MHPIMGWSAMQIENDASSIKGGIALEVEQKEASLLLSA